jgi:hypothetical protein
MFGTLGVNLPNLPYLPHHPNRPHISKALAALKKELTTIFSFLSDLYHSEIV